MKRSEMIKMMVEFQMNPPQHIRNMNDGGAQLIRLMDEMLTKIEEAGMLPPYNQQGSTGDEGLTSWYRWDEE